MKINPISQISYKASVRKNVPMEQDGTCGNSYDRQIKKIQAQKEKAIQLENFLKTRKIRKLLRDLPKDDIIILSNEFKNSSDINSEIVPDKMSLYYIPQKNTSSEILLSQSEEDLSYIEVQDDNGNIDEKGIVDYLKNLNRVLNIKS